MNLSDELIDMFSEMYISKAILKLQISDSEKFLLAKIAEYHSIKNDDEQFSHLKTLDHMCEYLEWDIKKGNRILNKLKKQKAVTISKDQLISLKFGD